MNVVWSPKAQADRFAIFDYLDSKSHIAAVATEEKIVSTIGRLEIFSESGRAGRVEGTRELVIEGMPYIAGYCIQQKDIRILRVFHGARRWPKSFE